MRIDSSVLINKQYAISCCAKCRQLYLLFAHMPKHLQFAQINKRFQSDVNKKLIVQRSELIVSKKIEQIEKNCKISNDKYYLVTYRYI